MIVQKTDHFSLSAIADSGQCFRWQRRGEGFRIIAGKNVVQAMQNLSGDELTLNCTQEEYTRIWKPYFDLDTDYGAVIAAIPPEDAYLRAAAEYGQGIRILRQDPWETLITFILSQRKNIPAIRQCVEKLCAACGNVICEETEGPLYAFPTPEAILTLGEERLRALGLGYRAPYVLRTAEAFCAGSSVQALEALSDEQLQSALCGFYGVGRKIALCTMLFGFHRMNAFPVDVWMQKVQKSRYPGGFQLERYAPWGGVMQQYMFAYERHLNGAGNEKSEAGSESLYIPSRS